MTNLSGATTAVFIISLSSALEVPVNVAWETKDGTAKAGTDYEAASRSVTFEAGDTQKQIQVTVYGREDGDTASRKFSILLYPPENAILDQTLTEVEIHVTDSEGVAVTSLVVPTGPRGLKGDPGLSAYELAKLQGFTGTLQEWLEIQNPSAEMLQKAEEAASSAAEAKSYRDQTQQIINDAGEQSTLVVLAKPDGGKNIGKCPSIAALRNIEPTANGQRINLAAYYDDGTANGAGEFYHDAADTTSTDNGGTVIVTAGGKRWVRVLSHALSWSLDMFGVKPGDDLSARLPGIMTSLIAQGGGTIAFRPNAAYTLTSTIVLDVGRVKLDGRGASITCNQEDGTYALIITSSVATPYGSPLRNRLISTTGLEFIGGGTRTKNWATLLGNGTNKPAQFCMNNLVVREFNIAVNCQQNAYMFEFDHCTFSRNTYGVYVPSDAGDSGERMTWINCDFTSNSYDEASSTPVQSYAFYTRYACSIRAINCSFDWQWCLMDISNTQIFFENCHLESPATNFITNPTTSYMYGIASGTSMINMSNCFILLNYAAGAVSPKTVVAPFYLANKQTKMYLDRCFLHIFGVSWLGTGEGEVLADKCATYNEFSPILGLSDSAQNNPVANGHFLSTSIVSGWTSTVASQGGTSAPTDDLTLDTTIKYTGAAASLKCYNRFAGVATTHTYTAEYTGGRYFTAQLTLWAVSNNNVVNNVKYELLDEFGNIIYSDTDLTAIGVIGSWASRKRSLDLYSLGVPVSRIKKVRVNIVSNAGNNSQFNIGRMIVQSY